MAMGRRAVFGYALSSLAAALFASTTCYGANFNCSWTDSNDNWTTAADWSGCNGSFPNNGGGNTYDATISDNGPVLGVPLLTSPINIGSVSISNNTEWDLSGPGATAALTGGLTNGFQFSPDGVAFFSRLEIDSLPGSGIPLAGGSTLMVGGTLLNSGNIDLGNASLSAPAVLSASVLDNTNTGHIFIQGSATNTATLKLGTGLTALDGSLFLDGANAQVQLINNSSNNSGLTGLNTVKAAVGSFSLAILNLANGSSVTTKGDLTISNADLFVDQEGQGGSTLTIGGKLTNDGSHFAQVFIGTREMSTTAPSTLIAAGLNNSGAGASLSVGANPTNPLVRSRIIINGDATNSGGLGVGGDMTIAGDYNQVDGRTGIGSVGNLSARQYSQSGGVTQLDGGTLSATNINITGGLFYGTGTVNGNLTNAATVHPGVPPQFAGNSLGRINVIGNYVQNVAGAFSVELDGTGDGQFDRMAITGLATLAGELAVSLFDGFTLDRGDTFDIMSFLSETGDFDTFSFDDSKCRAIDHDRWNCGQGLIFEEVFESNDLLLEVENISHVPEPGSLALFASAFLLFALIRPQPKRPT